MFGLAKKVKGKKVNGYIVEGKKGRRK